jgi:L-amino acid N-acyltransferase YncA
MLIRKVKQSDSFNIARIYNHYIKNTIITFEEQEVSPDDISNRIENVLTEPLPWIVAEKGYDIAGYAYATKLRTRSAYRFAVESTVYVD